MDRVLSVSLGVVIAREKIDHPWQEYAWRPVSVFLGAPEIGEWRELRRDATSVHYHAATLSLELHPKETIGYVANLDAGAPLVYVVLREGGDSGKPIDVAVVTASPYDAEVYGYDSSEIVGTVAMPAPLIELLEAFVAEHHVEEPFVKRQRQKHHRAEEHKFGQEPIAELRQRKGRPGASENE
jgi:Protein of unknown function (DUF3305)